MHVCIWVLMYISDAWIIYMAYIHFACVYSLNLVYSIHNIDYIYIHTFWSEKNLGCHCHSILSRHQRRSALARCFHGIYSLRGSCRRTWTTAVWSSSALQWGNLQWSPFGLLGENAWWIPGEYWWPWIERSEKMWKMGKTDRKMIHKWLVLHIYLQLQEQKHGKTWWDQWCQTHVYHYYIIWL